LTQPQPLAKAMRQRKKRRYTTGLKYHQGSCYSGSPEKSPGHLLLPCPVCQRTRENNGNQGTLKKKRGILASIQHAAQKRKIKQRLDARGCRRRAHLSKVKTPKARRGRNLTSLRKQSAGIPHVDAKISSMKKGEIQPCQKKKPKRPPRQTCRVKDRKRVAASSRRRRKKRNSACGPAGQAPGGAHGSSKTKW